MLAVNLGIKIQTQICMMAEPVRSPDLPAAVSVTVVTMWWKHSLSIASICYWVSFSAFLCIGPDTSLAGPHHRLLLQIGKPEEATGWLSVSSPCFLQPPV